MIKILHINKESIFFALWVVSLYAIAIPTWTSGEIIYVIGALCFGGYLLLKNIEGRRIGMSPVNYILFLLWLFFSAFLNDSLTYKSFSFAFLVVVCSPILNSKTVFDAREKAVTLFAYSFVFVPFIAGYCYVNKINLYGDGWGPLNFAAIFRHPMFLSALLGCADVVILWWIMKIKSRFLQILMIIVLLCSFFLGVISASRSALVAAAISCALLLACFFRLKRSLPIVLLILVGLYFASDDFFSNAEGIRDKIEAGKDEKYGSRTELWKSGSASFRQSPIIGIGHNVRIYNNEKVVGRTEAGSGWLSVLFQTGLVGFVLFMSIMLPSLKSIWEYRNVEKMQLLMSLFVFLLFHSVFEGYILTFGNPMAWLFWLLQGHLVLYSYNQ